MTDQHPLTEEICKGLVPFYLISKHDYIEMRAAADWQLQEVVEWIRTNPWVGSDCPIYDFEEEEDRLRLIEDLRQAMRPTTTQENN